MNIIYVSTLCSINKINDLYKNDITNLGQQIQKYHRLLVEGFNQNDVLVNTLSLIPINRKLTKKVFFKKSKEMINDNLAFNYISVINLPIIKNIWTMLMSYFLILKITKLNRDSVIICDVLNKSIAYGALKAAKFRKLKNIGIVTDIPEFLDNNKKNFGTKFNTKLINNFDSYLFLTQQMSEIIDTKGKDYVVIEGHADVKMHQQTNDFTKKYNKKVCLYAGGLKDIYGLDYMVKAFITANIKDAELHIYGSGDYEKELVLICEKHKNIRYFGVKPNSYIVNEEIKATLLINPRPTDLEYTKYSFPSKNMEYMVSGTPVLTTKLSGMPNDYYDYVYLIEDETVNGLSMTFQNVLNIPREQLHQLGTKAKEFILKEKNNIIQSKKIIDLIKVQ